MNDGRKTNSNLNNPNRPSYQTQINAYNKLIQTVLKKITVYSQYIYGIPSSTYLLTLLNLKNFFMHEYNGINNDNYICASFLTAVSMIQARLFIQAWELLSTIQAEILATKSYFYKTLLEPGSTGYAINQQDDTRLHLFITKIELIKSICTYEHGHITGFLDSLKSCINVYFYNNYSDIRNTISWTKSNESSADKYFIQNFIITNGKKLVELLIALLEEQHEIIAYSALKVVEFILDYYPCIFGSHYHKLIKSLLKLVSPKATTKALLPQCIEEGLEQHNTYINQYTAQYESTGVYFPVHILYEYFKHKSGGKTKEDKFKESAFTDKRSSVIIKQINYTLDTLINHLETLSTSEMLTIARKTNSILMTAIKNTEIDSVTQINIIKLIKKLYENINSNIFEILTDKNDNSQTELAEFIFNILGPCLKYKTQDFKNSINDILENNENTNVVIFILEKLSEDFYLFKDREPYLALLDWVTKTLSVIVSNFKNKENEFNLYYTYLVLHLLNTVLFGKAEIKSDLNFLFTNKLDSKFPSSLLNLIKALFELEEITLHDKAYLNLFELVADIFRKINTNFNKVLRINFGKLFEKQYTSLLNFIEKSGIYSENIFFLIKTLPLIEISVNDKNSILANNLKKIFISFLKNFSNFYNEDIYELFNLFLDKLANNLDENLIAEILNAIINKYNYKGSNLKQTCNKFFDIILNNPEYFNTLKLNIADSIKNYNEIKNKHDTGFAKQIKHIQNELNEKFDFYKKFFEYLKELKSNNDIFKQQNDIIEKSLDFDLVALASLGDENITLRINDIILVIFELLSKILDENVKSDKKDFGLLISQFINKLISLEGYFTEINKTVKNFNLLSENYKLFSKLSDLCQSLPNNFSDALTIIPNELVNANECFNIVKVKLLKYLFEKIGLKTIPFRQTVNEQISFIESLILNYKVMIRFNLRITMRMMYFSIIIKIY
jgi:hypothetical protein